MRSWARTATVVVVAVCVLVLACAGTEGLRKARSRRADLLRKLHRVGRKQRAHKSKAHHRHRRQHSDGDSWSSAAANDAAAGLNTPQQSDQSSQQSSHQSNQQSNQQSNDGSAHSQAASEDAAAGLNGPGENQASDASGGASQGSANDPGHADGHEAHSQASAEDAAAGLDGPGENQATATSGGASSGSEHDPGHADLNGDATQGAGVGLHPEDHYHNADLAAGNETINHADADNHEHHPGEIHPGEVPHLEHDPHDAQHLADGNETINHAENELHDPDAALHDHDHGKGDGQFGSSGFDGDGFHDHHDTGFGLDHHDTGFGLDHHDGDHDFLHPGADYMGDHPASGSGADHLYVGDGSGFGHNGNFGHNDTGHFGDGSGFSGEHFGDGSGHSGEHFGEGHSGHSGHYEDDHVPSGSGSGSGTGFEEFHDIHPLDPIQDFFAHGELEPLDLQNKTEGWSDQWVDWSTRFDDLFEEAVDTTHDVTSHEPAGEHDYADINSWYANVTDWTEEATEAVDEAQKEGEEVNAPDVFAKKEEALTVVKADEPKVAETKAQVKELVQVINTNADQINQMQVKLKQTLVEAKATKSPEDLQVAMAQAYNQAGEIVDVSKDSQQKIDKIKELREFMHGLFAEVKEAMSNIKVIVPEQKPAAEQPASTAVVHVHNNIESLSPEAIKAMMDAKIKAKEAELELAKKKKQMDAEEAEEEPAAAGKGSDGGDGEGEFTPLNVVVQELPAPLEKVPSCLPRDDCPTPPPPPAPKPQPPTPQKLEVVVKHQHEWKKEEEGSAAGGDDEDCENDAGEEKAQDDEDCDGDGA